MHGAYNIKLIFYHIISFLYFFTSPYFIFLKLYVIPDMDAII
jgi:hypothetical protein